MITRSNLENLSRVGLTTPAEEAELAELRGDQDESDRAVARGLLASLRKVTAQRDALLEATHAVITAFTGKVQTNDWEKTVTHQQRAALDELDEVFWQTRGGE